MKPEILKKWVKALRSGKYKQGQGHLKILNGQPKFCCLGVLCDLHAKACGGRWIDKVDIEGTGEGLYLDQKGVLPFKVMHWAGLNSNDPVLEDKKVVSYSAAELNDNGKRFTTIARLIEQAQKEKLI